MAEAWVLWAKFFISAGVVVLGGVKLTRYADQISDRFGLNKIWIGMMILGMITSLPELVASMASVVAFNAPNLSVGNIAGSVNINLMIVFLMDLFYRSGSVTDQVKANRLYNFLSEFYGILASIVVLEVFFSFFLKAPFVGHLSFGSIAIVLIYFFGARFVFTTSEHPPLEEPKNTLKLLKENRVVLGKLVLSAMVVVLGGIWLSGVCDRIALITSLGHTFTGTIFLGFATSLPEMVVSLWALRLGQFDLALGNIFGSNVFNIAILALCDLFDGPGALLSRVSIIHIFALSLSVLLTMILMIGIQKKGKRTLAGLGLDTILMMICFAIGMKILYDLTRVFP